MKALHRKTFVGLVGMVTLLALLAGCQEKAAEAPVEDASVAVETVLAEGETVCAITDFNARMMGIEREEPVYGDVIRGEVYTGLINCPGALKDARFVGINDSLNADWEDVGDNVNPHEWNFYFEYIPEDGGAWVGPGHNDDNITSYFILEGEGELKGQRLELDVDLSTMKAKYRIVQVVGAPDTATPAAAETVLAKGETVCVMSTGDSITGVTRDEPVYGESTRGEVVTGMMDCPDLLENAKFVSIDTLIDEDGDPGALNFYVEYIPEDGGAWLGTGHIDESDGNMTMYVTAEGDGELEGQRMEFVLNTPDMGTTYRIVQVGEQ